jgi:signal transduction histidine kinase
MEGLRQVSTDIAHDLRTPLSRLRQQLEETREAESIDRYEAGVDLALAQTDQILTIFRSLLRIGTLEGGVGRQRLDMVDLSEVMNRVHLAYRPVAEDAGKTLTATHAVGISVRGDAELLAQMTTNLIENAINHTPPGTNISTSLFSQDERVIVTVADSGPGIPAEERAKVLTRFYRLDRSRGTPGAGLGLALVAAIAALHGVLLFLEDNKPGLSIKLKFPRHV